MTPRRALLASIVAVVLVVVAYLGVANARIAWDLTAEGSATLSDETLRVLERVDGRVEISAFFPPDSVGRVEAATLLSRYRKANRRITFRILNPATAPGEAERLGVQEVGGAAVREVGSDEDAEIAQYTIEIDVTSAIARLLRDVQGTACFTTGHGERSSTSSTGKGFSQAAALLRENGYRTRSFNLLTSKAVPDDCAAVVMAAPTNRVGGDVDAKLVSYLRAAGKLLVLTDPTADGDLTDVTKRWGIRSVRGIVIEGGADAHLPGDLTSPVVTRYAGGNPVVRGLGPTFFPGVLGIEGKGTDDPGLTVTELAMTSEIAYLDRGKVNEFEPDVDVEGPVAIGAAADDSEVRDIRTSRARVRRTRILAWGDADFASNQYLNDGANARLWLQGIDWLTQPEDLITAVPAFPKVRELELTQARSRYMLFLTAGVVPGLFLIAGALVWVLRRGR